MFIVMIDQIEHLNNFSIQSYFVEQDYVTNELIQYSEQKLIDKNWCEWSFKLTQFAPTNSMQGNLML